jgi:RecB family endonuclease NucS
MGMIDTSAPFILYAKAEVFYEGRASSKLEIGNYLVIHKADGALLIQAATKTTPRNYQSPGAILTLDENTLVSKRKKETIKIIIHQLYNISYLQDWSTADIVITKTEKELVKKLIDNWSDYIPGDFVTIQQEFPTLLGPVDLVGVDTDKKHHVVEVKRKNISVPHVSQLDRYVSAVRDIGEEAVGYIAAPHIGKNALAYCEKQGFQYIMIDF